MKPTLAIARIAFRNAVRSKVMLVLLAALLLAIIGLPLTVKGDGTLAGSIQILLSYTLGAVMLILSIATVWAGCAAVSQEIESRQIHLVLTKPVSRVQVWLGKWLGLVALNGLLLVVAGVVVFGLLHWNTRPGRLTEADRTALHREILVARRVIAPEPIAIDDLVRQVYEERREAGALPPDTPVDQVLQAIRDSVRQRLHAVPTGFKTRWQFRVPGGRETDRPLALRYRFSSSQRQDAPVFGVWLVGNQDAEQPHQIPVANVPEGEHSVSIPAALAPPGARLTVEFANVNPVPVTVLFNPDDGLELLIHQGGFVGNYTRSLLVMFCQLTFLAALSVSAGTLWSLPTAVMATGYVLLLIRIGDYLETLAKTGSPYGAAPQLPGATPAFSLSDWIVRISATVQNLVTKPLRGMDPLAHLTVGELVGWDHVAVTVAIKIVLYSGALALIAGWLFNRREIGMAE